MSITLTNSTTSIAVVLDPDFGSTNTTQKISQTHSTISGRDVVYTYGTYKEFNYPISFVPYSDYLQVQEWWENQSELYLTDENATTTQVRIVNGSDPFKTVEWPYHVEMKGSLMLEQI